MPAAQDTRFPCDFCRAHRLPESTAVAVVVIPQWDGRKHTKNLCAPCVENVRHIAGVVITQMRAV